MQRVIEPTKVLIAECRRRGVPIVWTRHGTRGIEDGGPFMAKRVILLEGGLRRGTWGYEILDELAPRAEDWYVEKTRLSAFFETNLDRSSARLDAETVMITGVLTNQCVGATTRMRCSATTSPSSSRSAWGRRRRTSTILQSR